MQDFKKISYIWIILIQFALAFVWLHSGLSKWTSAAFMDGFSKTMEGFASKTSYVLYSNFLHNTVIPNAELFGNLIRTGEILVGFALVVGGIVLLWQKTLATHLNWLLIIAFFSGALMNLNFFLASGATSPSAWALNLLMVLLQLILGVAYILNRKELASL